MMTLRQYYLLKLIEECQEVSQCAAKQMQFGKDQTQANDGQSLSQAIPKEHFLTNRLNDLLAVATVLETMEEIDADIFLSEIEKERKIAKIEKYLKLSQTLGEVEHD